MTVFMCPPNLAPICLTGCYSDFEPRIYFSNSCVDMLVYSLLSSARASNVVGALRPMPLLSDRLIPEDQAEQEMHVAAVGSAFRRLGSMGSAHLAQVPYVPSDIRFRAASI